MSDKKSKTFEDYTDFLDTKLTKMEVAKLIEVGDLSSFNEEISTILQTFYNHKDNNIKRFGSVFNAIYFQHNSTFTLSQGMANDLVRKDFERHGLKSCDPDAYNDIVHRALAAGIFEKIRDQIGKKAALYKLVMPRYLEPLQRAVGKELLEAKEHKFIEWWDTTKVEDAPVERTYTEEQLKAREVADGLFKRKKT